MVMVMVLALVLQELMLALVLQELMLVAMILSRSETAHVRTLVDAPHV